MYRKLYNYPCPSHTSVFDRNLELWLWLSNNNVTQLSSKCSTFNNLEKKIEFIDILINCINFKRKFHSHSTSKPSLSSSQKCHQVIWMFTKYHARISLYKRFLFRREGKMHVEAIPMKTERKEGRRRKKKNAIREFISIMTPFPV